MKLGQTNDYYRARIDAVDDYVMYTETPDWKIMCAILGLPVPCKKGLEVPKFMEEEE